MALQPEPSRSYPFASHAESGYGLRLAASGTREDASATPHFFDGALEEPRVIADWLLALSRVARSRFYLPAAARELDPIVTANDETLRFEAFSSCCGVYARLDVRGAAIEKGCRRKGTTNVDFNPEMRRALVAIRADEPVALSVGRDEVALRRKASTVHEKKVALPTRWLRGLCEVQSYQRGLEPKLELSGAVALRFLQQLAARQPRTPGSLVVEGGGLRLVYPARAGEVQVGGAERLALLSNCVSPGDRVQVWADANSGVCALEAIAATSRMWVVLSPDASRGFSGEGQLLEMLARSDWRDAIARVQGELRWQSKLDAAGMAARLGVDVARVDAALAALGARGLVGYDAREGAYFHRELPFDADAVDLLQPRLRAAKKLLHGGVERLSPQEHLVAGSDVKHHVRLDEQGDRCTCAWFAKHQNARGPCKHILAAHLSR